MHKTGASTVILVALIGAITAWVEPCRLSPLEGGKRTKREEKEAPRGEPRVKYLGQGARSSRAPTRHICGAFQPLAEKREKSGKKATPTP